MAKRKTPISDQAINEDFPRFIGRVSERLKRGAQAYGDKSFSREPLELTGEMKEEIEDICGWGFINWRRLDRIERALEEAAKR